MFEGRVCFVPAVARVTALGGQNRIVHWVNTGMVQLIEERRRQVSSTCRRFPAAPVELEVETRVKRSASGSATVSASW